MRRLTGLFFVSAVLALLGPLKAFAENSYRMSDGELFFPLIQIEGSNSVSGRFSMVSNDPLIWAGTEFVETALESRTAASYEAQLNQLIVPEINVNGSLVSLRFNLTQNCDAAVCIEPVVESVVNNGREGSNVFTSQLTQASTFTCSSCHAISEVDGLAMDGIRRPGHSLLNAPKRSSFKNGNSDSLLAAVNVCVTEWMNGDPLTESDPEWVNLLNWLNDQNTQEDPEEVTIEIVSPPTLLTGGNDIAGRELFNTSCIVCHGFDGAGTQLAPEITNKGLSPELIARRVRTSGRSNSVAYDGLTGGVMPFWGADRLTDAELLDIIAYVSGGTQTEIDVGMDDPVVSPDTGCTSSSAKIGQQAVFRGFAHSVAGTATIIDDCTIEITGFVFDGGGINVQIYFGQGGDFREIRGGFSSSPNLVGIRYNGNTLRVTLPAGRGLEDFDSISVWCVPVGVSFGSGTFS
ncbi:MAG: DM13 domain-containing protein [Pseudohongiellaceae bacterium]